LWEDGAVLVRFVHHDLHDLHDLQDLPFAVPLEAFRHLG
jgi:hypothetical protein